MLWTGVATLALALTVAEAAAVSAMAGGAQRWWAGGDAQSLRRAGAILGDMVASRVGVRSMELPIAMQLEGLDRALLPLTGEACASCSESARVEVIDRRLKSCERSRIVTRMIVRERIREAIRRAERQVL
jgi:hypothetical protein